ncbi:MAG: GGDEF domain-containing protein [Xanthomonadaceae bacterium]|nr:GGDEF domain-containing protein [Xanthomonadaceae bacterium]
MNDEARRQELRIWRFGLATVTFAIWVGFILYINALGLFRLEFGAFTFPVAALVGGMVVSNMLFFTAFKTGVNLRFHDPSMTLPMMLTALLWACLTAGGLPEMRAVSFPAFIIVFMFGIFTLRISHYVLCWLFSMAGYTLVVATTIPDDAGNARIQLEIMHAALLAAMLIWVAYFGHYVGRLREKLHSRNSELQQALALVEELAVRDDLTGLHNRRFVMDALKREQQRSDRHGDALSLLVLDIDRFKEINDQHGHPVGDEVLKSFVTRLSQAVRGADVVGATGVAPDVPDTIGRFGGEEFIVILPHTDTAGAQRVAERIRVATSATPFGTSAGPVSVTVSLGVARHQEGETPRSILERVDSALYAAKHGGRNRTAIASGDRDGTPMLHVAES